MKEEILKTPSTKYQEAIDFAINIHPHLGSIIYGLEIIIRRHDSDADVRTFAIEAKEYIKKYVVKDTL